uniref:Terpene synthase n=1 Tax=Vitiosangium cumulatum TaxID=1867796 RepID=A0A7D4XJF0_9BACT|nr:terpene cyclase [Vitiosangium cumulatum]
MDAFHLPKLYCPFPQELNPLMNDIEGEALERWAKYLGVHAKHSVFRKLQRSHFPVLLGRCHPGASKEGIRAALDFLIWNFSWDDQVDVGDVPAEWVRQQSEMALAVLKGAIPYHDAPPLLWLLASIRDRIAERMPAEWMERFIHSCHCYFKGTIWEAEVRSQRVCLDVDTYIELRRLSVGTYMGFTQVEAIEGFLLPESVLSHPAIAELIQTATDVIAWANDLFSLAQDLKDDFHPNLVFSIQKQHGLTLQAAIDRAVEMHDAAVRRFIELEANLPSFGEHDANVATLVTGVRRWIRANVDWSIQTGRYEEGGEAEAAPPKSRVA